MPERLEGPTAIGAAYAEALWMDDTGAEVSKDAATRAEITEFDEDGTELLRTYVGSEKAHTAPWDQQVLFGAEELNIESQDAIKEGTWDLWVVRDGVWLRHVRTRAELLEALELATKPQAEQREALGQFATLPAWVPAPPELKLEVYAWLESTRSE